jgi:predicted transcriptional regulator
MANSPFSVRFDESTKSRLEQEAKREDRSAGYVINKAVEHYLNKKDNFRKEMETLVAEANKGVFISEEAMDKWMESWDTNDALPPPEPDIFPQKR